MRNAVSYIFLRLHCYFGRNNLKSILYPLKLGAIQMGFEPSIKFAIIPFLLMSGAALAQNVSVDPDIYTPQQLVEDVLINSGCIDNIQVTHAVSGNYNGADKSFGYFENNGGPFPFANGIVMSTGRLSSVPGPNSYLSDGDAPGWGGDADLEQYLNINHTVNATIIEFDFTPHANNIRFRYIFASEEYRKNNATTCQYSDAFAFLIKPLGGTYQNIAVIPGTNIPVKVTTVHPEIPGGCPPENEQYFGGWNGQNAPINFNGQTRVLTAEAQVTPGTTYHIKLVIADEQNYRYDSAVFLEGESFNIGADLGNDITGLCPGEPYTLNPQGNGTPPQNYHWYSVDQNGNETLLTQGTHQNTYTVTESGTYKVVLDYGPNCTASDIIEVSYVDFSDLEPKTIYSCDVDGDGISTYNLPNFNGTYTQGHANFEVTGFFRDSTDAENNVNPIQNPEAFHNTSPNQVIYVRIETPGGCSTTLAITLALNESNYNPVYLAQCSNTAGSTLTYLLTDAVSKIQEEIGQPVQGVQFYETAADANTGNNPLASTYSIEASALPHSLYAKLGSNIGCQGLVELILATSSAPKINPLYKPDALCPDNLNGVTIHSGVMGDADAYRFEWENGATTPTITVNEPGTYQVHITKITLIGDDTLFCATDNSISVVLSEKPIVHYELIGAPNDYQVKINATGNGDYRYAIDAPNGPYSKNNIFPVETGRHYIYVKDRNGCGVVKRSFMAIGFMKFFTPNGDGFNDYWHLLGIDSGEIGVEEVQIFDRYGKLLITLGPYDEWDGTFHGKNLYPNDYWFKIVFKDGSVYTNHLTLLR